jgi:RNA polymerase sigma factor for flagellar operon FliA
MAKKSTKKSAEPEAVQQAWKRYKSRGAKGGRQEDRDIIVGQYMQLVRYAANHAWKTLPNNIDVEDLVSTGFFGLLDAIEGFDLSRKIKFKTYCMMRIRGAMLDGLRREDWIPRLVRLKASQHRKAAKNVMARTGLPPTQEEMADELGLTEIEYAKFKKAMGVIHVYPLSDKFEAGTSGEGVDKIDVIADPKSAEPIVELESADAVVHIMRCLTAREKRIVMMYYYMGFTMKQISEALDLTESRVCQIHSAFIERLRCMIERDGLDNAEIPQGRNDDAVGVCRAVLRDLKWRGEERRRSGNGKRNGRFTEKEVAAIRNPGGREGDGVVQG